MTKKYRVLKIEVERHWIILTAVSVIFTLLYFGSVYADQSNCSTKNPTVDCAQRGTIDISQLYNNASWVQTSGFGSHWIVDSTGKINFQPEFRDGYYHAVCANLNTTCNWHIDKYPATQDIPFGTILHLSDYLTLVTPLGSEKMWQLILWVGIVFGVTALLEGIARLVERL